jgi:sugar lactone lactonase YvrE
MNDKKKEKTNYQPNLKTKNDVYSRKVTYCQNTLILMIKKILALACLTICLHSEGQTINTIAGTGAANYSGDGGPATAADIWKAVSMKLDNAGNIYISDQYNYRIRKISTTGIITTIAGTGTAGFSGDGGPATAAELEHPYGMDIDSAGNLFFADGAKRIRKIDISGNISTVAGTATMGYSGDGGPATAAQLNVPEDVAVDNEGGFYICEYGNGRIRKVNSTGIISTVAGNGSMGYSGDGGPATAAGLNQPNFIALDRNCNLIIGDINNNRIRKVSSGGVISTIVGTGIMGHSGDGGPATAANISGPNGVFVTPDNTLYFVQAFDARIRKVSPSGIISTLAGTGTVGFSGDGGPATSAQFKVPQDIVLDACGNIYVADEYNSRIRKISYSTASNCSGITRACGGTTGIHEANRNSGMQIVPNPSRGLVSLFLDASPGVATITIYNLAGTIVKQLNANTRTDINLDLPAGIYLLRAVTDQDIYTNKLLIE